MSRTITLSVPDEMFKAMQSFPEINYSELARERISEYLATVKEKQEYFPYHFLLLKDLVFSREKIIEIHDKIEKNKNKMGELFWVSTVFDLDLLDSLANFLFLFAKAHPFEDGNKRTAFVCVDAFLRLNRFKLFIEAKKSKTGSDEEFFWQNSNQQKKIPEIRNFLKEHLVPCKKPCSVEEAINDSIKENGQLLENLAG